MPSIQKHIKGPSAMVETYSRSITKQTAEMVNVGKMWSPGRGGLDSRVKQQEPWQRRAGLESQAAGALPSFTAFLPCRITTPLTVCQYPAHFPRLSPSTLSHGTILDSSLPAGFLRLCLHLSSLMKDHLILLHRLYTCIWLLSGPGG